MTQSYQQYIDLINAHPVLFVLLAAWAIVWRGIAMWKAAQNKSMPWFVALLIINSFGILDIIYVFYFSNRKRKQVTKI